jgi:hypothetical protein
MTPQKVSQLMKEIPELESLLYDLDLMPEQVKPGSKEEWKMFMVAMHFEAALATKVNR